MFGKINILTILENRNVRMIKMTKMSVNKQVLSYFDDRNMIRIIINGLKMMFLFMVTGENGLETGILQIGFILLNMMLVNS